MKTTVEIRDALFERAKLLAREEGITFREVLERGLQRVLAEAEASDGPGFRLQDASVPGRGLYRDAEAKGGFKTLRELAYDDPTLREQ